VRTREVPETFDLAARYVSERRIAESVGSGQPQTNRIRSERN